MSSGQYFIFLFDKHSTTFIFDYSFIYMPSSVIFCATTIPLYFNTYISYTNKYSRKDNTAFYTIYYNIL